MGVPSITTNLSGFGSFMEDNIENPKDYGIYIVDRKLKSVEESLQQLTDTMLEFCQFSRRERINQRNRTERLADLLDWKSMGANYQKARLLALRRAFPDCYEGIEFADDSQHVPKIPTPMSVPGSPKVRNMRVERDYSLTMDNLSLGDAQIVGITEEDEFGVSIKSKPSYDDLGNYF